MQKNLITIILGSFILLLSSCTSLLPEPYKIDIQQGNKVEQKNLNKLKLGMTSDQVKFVLGTPMLMNGNNNHRWDYIYYLRAGTGDLKKSRIVLYFKDSKLSKIDDSHFVTEPEKPSQKAD